MYVKELTLDEIRERQIEGWIGKQLDQLRLYFERMNYLKDQQKKLEIQRKYDYEKKRRLNLKRINLWKNDVIELSDLWKQLKMLKNEVKELNKKLDKTQKEIDKTREEISEIYEKTYKKTRSFDIEDFNFDISKE